jgi:hypothetical protein
MKNQIDKMLSTRQAKNFKSQPKGRGLRLNQNSQVFNQTVQTDCSKKQLSRKEMLAQIRVREPLDPLESDYAETVAIPTRVNRIDQIQPAQYEVSIHDNPMEFVIKARHSTHDEEHYEIRITGDKNLKMLRGQFTDNYPKIARSLRIMNN